MLIVGCGHFIICISTVQWGWLDYSPTKSILSGTSRWASYFSMCLDSTPYFSGSYLQDARIVSRLNQRSTIEEKPLMTCSHAWAEISGENCAHGVCHICGCMRATLGLYPSTPFSLSIAWRFVLFLHVYLAYVCRTCGSLWSSEQGIRPPGTTRVTSSSEPPDGSSENQTHFYWKVIKCSEQMNRLFLEAQFFPEAFLSPASKEEISCSNHNPNSRQLKR